MNNVNKLLRYVLFLVIIEPQLINKITKAGDKYAN